MGTITKLFSVHVLMLLLRSFFFLSKAEKHWLYYSISMVTMPTLISTLLCLGVGRLWPISPLWLPYILADSTSWSTVALSGGFSCCIDFLKVSQKPWIIFLKKHLFTLYLSNWTKFQSLPNDIIVDCSFVVAVLNYKHKCLFKSLLKVYLTVLHLGYAVIIKWSYLSLRFISACPENASLLESLNYPYSVTAHYFKPMSTALHFSTLTICIPGSHNFCSQD